MNEQTPPARPPPLHHKPPTPEELLERSKRRTTTFWRKFFPDRPGHEEVKDQFGQFEFSKEEFRRSIRRSRVHIVRAGVIGFGAMTVLTFVAIVLMGKPTEERMEMMEILHYRNTLHHARDRRRMMLEGKVHELPPDDVRTMQDLAMLKEMEMEHKRKGDKTEA